MTTRKAIYIVAIKDHETKKFEELEPAIRYWDSISYNNIVEGEITIQVYHDGICVRDANILRVSEEGYVYLSPFIASRA